MTDARLTHALGVLMLCAFTGWSWQARVAPAMRDARAGRQQLAQLQEQIAQTEQLVERAGGPQAWMTAQRDLLRRLAARVPSSEEMPRLLDALVNRVVTQRWPSGPSGVPDAAGVRPRQLKLVNVAQGNVEPLLQADGATLALGSRACVRLPVTVTLEGRFRPVVAYLEELTGRGFPGVVKVDQISFTVKEPTTATLTATVSLVLYALE